MKSEDVLKNVTGHNACADGLIWVAGKTSTDIWETFDTNAIGYLLWWATKNAGQPGWKPLGEVRAIIGDIIELACPYLGPVMTPVLWYKYETCEDFSAFYAVIEKEINWEDPKNLPVFESISLPIVKKLRPNI